MRGARNQLTDMLNYWYLKIFPTVPPGIFSSYSDKELKKFILDDVCPKCDQKKKAGLHCWHISKHSDFTSKEEKFLEELRREETTRPTGRTISIDCSNMMVVGTQKFSISCSLGKIKRLIVPDGWGKWFGIDRIEKQLEHINKREYILVYIGQRGSNYYLEENRKRLREIGLMPTSIEEVMLFLLINEDEKVLTGKRWPDYRQSVFQVGVGGIRASSPDQPMKFSFSEYYQFDECGPGFYDCMFLFSLSTKD